MLTELPVDLTQLTWPIFGCWPSTCCLVGGCDVLGSSSLVRLWPFADPGWYSHSCNLPECTHWGHVLLEAISLLTDGLHYVTERTSRLSGKTHCDIGVCSTRLSRGHLTRAEQTVHCAHRGLHKNIVSTTAPECAVLSVLSLGVALWTGQSGASEVTETCFFLASIWLAFAGHVVLFWLWLPRRGRWTALVDSEI